MFQRFYRACDPVTLERFWWLVSGQLYQAIGLVVYGKTTRLYALSIWMAFVSSIFTLAYRAVDSYVYLIPVIIAFAIWAGLGISGLAHVYIARYSRLAVIVGLLLNSLKLILHQVAQIDHSKSNEVTTEKISFTSIEP